MERESITVEISVPIASTGGIVEARQKGRGLATEMGFSASEATMIAAAISELARNIVQYAAAGEIELRCDESKMLLVIARDSGPGIPDPDTALRSGYSTSGGLGLGLPGVQRIADFFEIRSNSQGTTVTFGKQRR